MRMRDRRQARAGTERPFAAGPSLPAVLLLIEDVKRLVAELGELGAPARAAPHGAVGEDGTDHVDFLTVVHLIPERLQDLSNRLGLGVPAIHQPRDILEAHVARLELLMVQHPHSARSAHRVLLEREVHFLDAVTLGRLAEGGFRARRAAAEEDAVRWFHGQAVYLA